MKIDQALRDIETAGAAGQLSPAAVAQIRRWLCERHYADYLPPLLEHIADRKWRQLDDVFWTVIPFGTGGRRGRMYPIGSNAINDRTIGESAQGLADYVRTHTADPALRSCAVAYDTRHRSRHFAQLCAGIMAAAGFRVYFLDGYRTTPELSFLVRHRQCTCGIMVTASHNPPSDNAVKVYWSSGGQVLPPHDQGIIDAVLRVTDIVCCDFDEGIARGEIVLCTEEIDQAYHQVVCAQGFGGPRDVGIIFSPLHGASSSAVLSVLEMAGFPNVSLYPPHAEPNGDFPHVPGQVANPENPQVFDSIIEYAQEAGADLILVTDPDGDRMGCAAPRTLENGADWAPLDGNQLGALLADYVLARRRELGTLSPRHYLVKTLVTTDLIRRIGERYGVRTWGDLPVGFKWIGQAIDEQGPAEFVFGGEESHGYLAGTHVRDKDGVVACLLMAELAARLREKGKSVHQQLEDLHRQYGVYQERLTTLMMEGSEGMARMERLMRRFRERPPDTWGGMAVTARRDYANLRVTDRQGVRPLTGPRTDMVVFDLEQPGNRVAVRPSGTEPKAKFYLFAHAPAGPNVNVDATRSELRDRLDRIADEIRVRSEEV
jgi:phosphomannomutase